MPRETVHWGKKYLIVEHPETEDHSGYWSEYPYEGRQTDSKGVVLPFPPGTSYAQSPSVEVVWAKPEGFNTPLGEDAEGWVNLAFRVNNNDFEHNRDLSEDTDEFRIFTRSLTRRQINDTIKTLKRARDAAFGEDE